MMLLMSYELICLTFNLSQRKARLPFDKDQTQTALRLQQHHRKTEKTYYIKMKDEK